MWHILIHYQLERTIIFGLNCTKIYGRHMATKDFCGEHVSSIDFLCLEHMSSEEICGGHVFSVDFGAIKPKNNGPL